LSNNSGPQSQTKTQNERREQQSVHSSKTLASHLHTFKLVCIIAHARDASLPIDVAACAYACMPLRHSHVHAAQACTYACMPYKHRCARRLRHPGCHCVAPSRLSSHLHHPVCHTYTSAFTPPSPELSHLHASPHTSIAPDPQAAVRLCTPSHPGLHIHPVGLI